MRFGVREGLQSIGKACGPQIDQFSIHFGAYRFIFNYFYDFGHFGIDFGGLPLFPEALRTLRECPGGPGTL